MRLTGREPRPGGSRPVSPVPPAPPAPAERARANHRGPRIGPLSLTSLPGLVAVGIGVLLLAASITGLTMTSHSRYAPPHVAAVKPVLPPVGTPQTPQPEIPDQVSPPVSLTIPVIGVLTRLIHLGITSSGALQVPKSTTVAGWYTGSPAPGAIGSSVIVGHVDSTTGPGVFYRLSQLHRGDRIYVKQRGGRVAEFGVDSVQEYKKNAFPTLKVYGMTPTPQLRLITCGGTFDTQTGHYLSNIVVYATLAS
jgi:LPXTG-site transpeptidase (sortase) family protein